MSRLVRIPAPLRAVDDVWGICWGWALALLALRPTDDYDVFWQLKSGEVIWQGGAFLYRDTFSLAAETFRLEHCWLHDLVLYALYRLGGYPALTLLKTALVTLCGVLLWRWQRQRGVDAGVLLPALLLCLYASSPSWAERPQLWTFLLALLYLQLLYAGRERGWRVWLWLAPLMLLWANLHAGCIFGLVLIGGFLAAEALRAALGGGSWRGVGRLALAGGLAFAAAFVNPYGYRIPLGQLLAHLDQYKVQTGNADVPMLGNMEWLPPTLAQVPLFYLLMALWGGLLLWRWRKLDLAEGLFFLGFAYMGFGQVRHTTLVALLAAFFLPRHLQELFMALQQTQSWRFWRRASLVSTVLILLVLLGGRLRDGSFGWGLKQDEFPEAAATFVQQQQLPDNLYNAYDWGGYLIWRLYPDYRVFLDSRQTSPEHFAASNVIDNAERGWQETLDRYRVDTIITRTCYYDSGAPLRLVDALAASPHWLLVYQDATALVYSRRGTTALPALPPGRAFVTMLQEAQRLRREDAGRSQVELALGHASLQLGQLPQALEYFRDYLKKHPDDPGVRSVVERLSRTH